MVHLRAAQLVGIGRSLHRFSRSRASHPGSHNLRFCNHHYPSDGESAILAPGFVFGMLLHRPGVVVHLGAF